MFKDIFKTIQVGYLITHEVYADFFLIWQKDKKEQEESPINVYTDVYSKQAIYMLTPSSLEQLHVFFTKGGPST